MRKASNILHVFVLAYCLFLKVNRFLCATDSCRTPDGMVGKCIAITSCTSIYNLLVKPDLNAAETNFLRRSQCGYVGNQPYVCCMYYLPVPPDCGLQITDKIFGGQVTKIDEYPWMALLEYSKGPHGNTGFHCGGTLINKRYVITAAHCVSNQTISSSWSLISVRLGEWDLRTDEDCSVDNRGSKDCALPHKDVPVVEQIIHPEYNPRTQRNDIALLRLGEAVEFTYFVKPICLPLEEPLRNDKFEGYAMDVAGWGYTEKNHSSPVKLKAILTGSTFDDCKRLYQRVARVQLWDKQLCAGSNVGADTCKGDSGGPIMTAVNQRHGAYHYLAGITSFGSTPCGLDSFPGVYTRVGAYIDWIKSQTMKS